MIYSLRVNIMSKCLGCGIKTDKAYCNRCFKIKNYGINIERDNECTFNTDDGLEVLVLDALFLPNELHIRNDVLVVVNKRDLVEASDESIIEYVEKYDINPIDIIVISALKNYNMDLLYETIKDIKDNKLYFVGSTKSGKTAIINKLLYDYKQIKNDAISSFIPNITSDTMSYKFGNKILVDTPSIKDKSIISKVDSKKLKEIEPVKIKQIVYQNNNDIFNIGDIISVVCQNSIAFNFNQDIKVARSKNILRGKEYNFKLNRNQDLVIENMGYIRTNGSIKIITYDNINIYIRNSIGGSNEQRRY